MDYKYKFKTKPYKHQKTALDLGGQRKFFGYFMEMGTGKSKVPDRQYRHAVHAKGARLCPDHCTKRCVYRNWVSKEIPEHMPDDIPVRVIRWVAGANKKQQEEMRSVKDKFDGLTVFVMNVEAFSSVKGKQAGEWLGRAFGHRGMIAIDESTTIKNHQAKRTKSLTKISQSFKYKRLLTGSPITKSPLDIFPKQNSYPGLLGTIPSTHSKLDTPCCNAERWVRSPLIRSLVLETSRN